jgi:hypothetical protein
MDALLHHLVGLSPTVGEHPQSASLRTSSLALIPTEPRFTADTEAILCVSGAEARLFVHNVVLLSVPLVAYGGNLFI